MVYIFLYNVIYIKSDFSKLKRSSNQKMILLGSDYCLNNLNSKNRACFDKIYEIPGRDFHAVNHDAVAKIVLKYVKKYGPENIQLLTNEDSTQLTCASLREKYGIPGPSVEAILPFVNKVETKKRLGNSVKTPKFISFDKIKYTKNKEAYLSFIINEIGFPMFAKPVDCVSSIETHYIPVQAKLEEVAEHILQNKYDFEIDEYIDGDIYHCDVILVDKKMEFFVIGKYGNPPAKFKENYPYPILQITNKNLTDIFTTACKKIIRKLRPHSGAYHIEAFVEQKSKKFVFLEISARTGGVLIPFMCEKRFGINTEEKHYLTQMGFIKKLNFTTKNIFAGSVTFPTIAGKVKNIVKPKIDINHSFYAFVKPGDTLTSAYSLLDVSCGLLFWDQSYEEVLKTFEMIKNYNPIKIIPKLPTLQEPEKIFKILFDTLPFLFWKSIDGIYQGTNFNQIKNFGFNSLNDIIGKNIYEIVEEYEEAKLIEENDIMVMNSNSSQIVEETITNPDGKQRIYYSQKSPIHDDKDNVIGLIGFSMDITDIRKKERESTKIVNLLYNIVPYIFWKDLKGIYQGANQNEAITLGLNSPNDMIGKTISECISDKEAAILIDKNDNKIMQENVTRIVEEKIAGKTYLSQKSPIHDDNGNVTGMLGFSMDITELKKKEDELKQAQMEEQNKFRKVVEQVAHDIRSPLSSLQMILKAFEADIPENARTALRRAATGINDIANNLLSQYKKPNSEITFANEDQQPILVSLTLLELLTEKKYQYKKKQINFISDFSPSINFAFIKSELVSFRRMISNIINNAVEALERKKGIVNLDLTGNNDTITISIKDNGKGMPQEIVDKIINNINVATTKQTGHGIGLSQVREHLKRNDGKLTVDSKIGRGSTINLIFPRIAAPNWFIDRIVLNAGDTVVILDDDQSTHDAWNFRFNQYLNTITVKHFTQSEDAITFINSFCHKDKILLLTDFELLKQEMNGLNVIECIKIKRSILVTSHYANQEIQNLAAQTNTKILPKQLASDIEIALTPININKVDIVIIDDNQEFANSLAYLFEKQKKKTDVYYNPNEFLANLKKYPTTTKLFIDNDFAADINGFDLAKQLHKAGYKYLYLLSGKDLTFTQLPVYLTAILKTDIESIYSLV